MDKYHVRICQEIGVSDVWRQPDQDCAWMDYHQVKKIILAGYLAGRARWAETAEAGMFLYGIDRLGKAHETGTGSPDFSY